MTQTEPVSRALTDEELVKRLRWPFGLSAKEIRTRLARVERHIDFDGTVTDEQERIRPTFCGRPLADFLAEEPFILQTWGSKGAVPFFQRHPHLPQPFLIISPTPISVASRDLWFDPLAIDPDFSGSRWLWKDLHALGVVRGTVYDDWIGHVWAPGCHIVSTF